MNPLLLWIIKIHNNHSQLLVTLQIIHIAGKIIHDGWE